MNVIQVTNWLLLAEYCYAAVRLLNLELMIPHVTKVPCYIFPEEYLRRVIDNVKNKNLANHISTKNSST